jgi:hypothetical protein
MRQAAAEFGGSDVTESLATSLYLVGLGFEPYSQGHSLKRWTEILFTSSLWVLYMIRGMAPALATNIGAQLLFHFLAGFSGSIYKKLGTYWTFKILVCNTAIILPVPHLFYFYSP